MDTIMLNLQGPFSFFKDQELPYLFEQAVAAKSGLYLWAVRTPDGLKVCYVGKAGGTDTNASLGDRVMQGLKAGLAGDYIQVVDLDAWKRGHRKVIHDFGCFNAEDYGDSLEQMHRDCVGLLASVDGNKAAIECVERSLIRRFRTVYDDGPDYSPFLSNKAGGSNPEGRKFHVLTRGPEIIGMRDGTVLDQDGNEVVV